MLRWLNVLLVLAWGLWIGGLLALILFVIALFGQDRSVGAITAPLLFRTFLIWSFGFAVVAGLAAVAVWLRVQTKAAAAVMILLLTALTTIGANGFYIQRMGALRTAGQSQSDEFKSLHGQSNVPYLVQAGCLVVAGVLLPAVIGARARLTASSRRREGQVPDPASASPVEPARPG